MKIRPVGAELFLADGQTDMTKLLAAFRNFANAPQNCIYFYIHIYAPEDYQIIRRFNRLDSTYRLLFVIVPGCVLCETGPEVCAQCPGTSVFRGLKQQGVQTEIRFNGLTL